MHTYTAHLTGPRGASLRIDILADDLTHARELAREHGLASFGRHGFSFTVWLA